jgi:hypothetical protein
MAIWALTLLMLGWLAILPKENLALMEHGLMMPIMLIPMLLRLDLYIGRARPSAGFGLDSRITGFGGGMRGRSSDPLRLYTASAPSGPLGGVPTA